MSFEADRRRRLRARRRAERPRANEFPERLWQALAGAGTLIGQPRVIELEGFTNAFNGIPGPLVSLMSARLEKK